MFGRSLDQARDGLSQRFEADGDTWLFRAKPTAVPVRVSQQERDDVIADVLRGLRRLSWGMLVGMFAALGVVIAIGGDTTDGNSDGLMYVAMTVIIGVFAIGWWRVWSLPSRRFERRAPAGVARTRDEARDRHFERLGWGQILIGGLVAVGIAGSRVVDPRESGASHVFFGVLAAGAVIALAITAWRKWRHGRARAA